MGFNLFDPFEQQSQVQPSYVDQQPTDLAGRLGPVAKQAKDLVTQMGMDPKNPMTSAIIFGMMQQAAANDIPTLERQAAIYEGMQNRLADAANVRAMKANTFANLMSIPKQWTEAMAERYRFVPQTLDYVTKAAQTTPSFGTRQYINI